MELKECVHRDPQTPGGGVRRPGIQAEAKTRQKSHSSGMIHFENKKALKPQLKEITKRKEWLRRTWPSGTEERSALRSPLQRASLPAICPGQLYKTIQGDKGRFLAHEIKIDKAYQKKQFLND